MLRKRKLVVSVILAACFLTAIPRAFADDRKQLMQELQHEQVVHEQLLHDQLLHEKIMLQQMLAQQNAQAPVIEQPAPVALAASSQTAPIVLAQPPQSEPQQELQFELRPQPVHRPLVEVAALPGTPPEPPESPPAPIEPPSVSETAVEPQASPQSDLAIRRGWDAGGALSKYEYHEKVSGMPFVNTKGYKAGVETSYTGDLADDYWFLRGEGRLAYGTVDYSGSGSRKDNEEYTWEIRALAGKDFIYENYGLSPYIGYGSRFLHNDIRGTTSTGQMGYRRNSTYQYIPLGFTHRFRLVDGASRLATNLEYDYFLVGHQRSILSDVVPGMITIKNTQRKAYGGAKASVMLESGDWAVGPWFSYWHIKDSNIDCVPGFCGLEPNNTSIEFGVKVIKKVF
jgi:hypothetical protein